VLGEHDLYDGYDLDAMFDTVVISGETGMRKPDPAIYLLTADKLGIQKASGRSLSPFSDRTVSLDQAPDGYRAMHSRKALKILIQP
jgi:beta-phosphoglucomutase-like phosphatase (HAD superfamily)